MPPFNLKKAPDHFNARKLEDTFGLVELGMGNVRVCTLSDANKN